MGAETTELLSQIFHMDEQMKQQKANLKAQEQAYEYSAKLADREAKNAEDQTNEQDARLRNQNEYIRSTQLSLYGKSGAALSGGSPLAVMAETAANQEIEVMELRRSGAIERQRYEQQAEMYRYQARAAAAQRKNIGWSTGDILGTVSSGLGMVSDAFGAAGGILMGVK